MNYRPVFIAGCDRSGTTLLGDMLGSARWTFTTPESQFLHDMVLQLRLGSFRSPEQAAAWLLDHFRFVAWGMPLALPDLADLIELENPRATMQRLLARYVAHVHPDKSHADVWVDHTPDNFKYHPLLKSLFPEARFIHIVRDGRAVCDSIKHLDWGPNNAYSASRHWADRLQQALTVEVAEADNCMRVRFEELLEKPEQVMADICAFIDVPFDPAMVDGGGLVVPDFTRDQHALVGQRPQAARAERWRGRLTEAELRDFESYPLTHTLLQKLGYAPVFDEPPARSTLRVLGCYCHEFAHYLLNRLRHRTMERRAVVTHRHGVQQTGIQARDAKQLADLTTATPQQQ